MHETVALNLLVKQMTRPNHFNFGTSPSTDVADSRQHVARQDSRDASRKNE